MGSGREGPRGHPDSLGLVAAPRAEAQAPGLGASVELVDPKFFRVCADPRNLPFSAAINHSN